MSEELRENQNPESIGDEAGQNLHENPNSQYGNAQYGDPNSQYGNPQYGNPNQQYGNPNGQYQQYGNPNAGGKRKGDGKGLGIASMVLGILAVLTFAFCINYILAVIAIVLGIVQIVKNEKKGMAIVGIVTSVISIILSIVLWVGMLMFMKTPEFDKIMNEYGTQYYEEYQEEYEGLDMPGQEYDCPDYDTSIEPL